MQTAEQHLEYAEEIADHFKTTHPKALNQETSSEFIASIDNLDGLFKVRMAAFLAKKGKATLEARDYDSVEEIVQLFIKELHEINEAGGLAQLPIREEWMKILQATKAEPQQSAAAAEGSKLLSTSELKSKEGAADRMGYKPGVMVFEKDS